ncbi:unnamed protein product [Dicrocoelium dendriticum]|nr:unnamed protein product [Dicrocoelium dendriticum]
MLKSRMSLSLLGVLMHGLAACYHTNATLVVITRSMRTALITERDFSHCAKTTVCFFRALASGVRRSVPQRGVPLRQHNRGLKLITLQLASDGAAAYWTAGPFGHSDHALVCAKICMCFGGSRNTKHRKIDVNRLTDSSVQASYQSSLAYALSCNPPQEVEQHWTCIRKAMTISGQSCCGLTRRPLKSWISARSLELFERRKDIPAESDCNERRRSANRLLKQSLRKDRETWWSERALEMETAALSGNTRRLFQLIRSTGLRKPGVSEVICEVDESPITNQQRRMDRWAEHFHSQFNWPPPSISTCSTPCCPPWLVPLNPPSEAEVCLEIRRLKRFKAAGLDGLPPELFKYGGVAIINQLTALFAKIWHEEKVPSSWGESVIVPIFKKGARTSCANHRGISLISVASKLLASILLRRLSPVRESYYREEQAGFRPGRGCVDQIFTLRQLLEHRHIYHRPTIVAFLDIRAAFDSVDRPALWRCLLKNGDAREIYRHLTSTLPSYIRQSEGLWQAFLAIRCQ